MSFEADTPEMRVCEAHWASRTKRVPNDQESLAASCVSEPRNLALSDHETHRRMTRTQSTAWYREVGKVLTTMRITEDLRSGIRYSFCSCGSRCDYRSSAWARFRTGFHLAGDNRAYNSQQEG